MGIHRHCWKWTGSPSSAESHSASGSVLSSPREGFGGRRSAHHNAALACLEIRIKMEREGDRGREGGREGEREGRERVHIHDDH